MIIKRVFLNNSALFSDALTVAVAIENIVAIDNSYMKHIRIWDTSLIFLTNKATDSHFNARYARSL